MSSPVDKATAAIVVGVSGAGGSSLWLWLGANHHAIAAVCGIGSLVVAFIALGVNIYYQHKRSKGGWVD